MTPPKGERMEMTEENFFKVLDFAVEIIFEQKAEISKLKSKVNDLTNQLKSPRYGSK